MDIFTLMMWICTIIFLIWSFIKDKKKTIKSLKMAQGMGKNMIVSIISIVFLIGLILAVLPPEEIALQLEQYNTTLTTVIAATFGTITLIPAFIAYPLVATLIDAGVDIIPSTAFLTTLTMVGIVTFPLEKRKFGYKFAITRNLLIFIFAIMIAFAMGVIL